VGASPEATAARDYSTDLQTSTSLRFSTAQSARPRRSSPARRRPTHTCREEVRARSGVTGRCSVRTETIGPHVSASTHPKATRSTIRFASRTIVGVASPMIMVARPTAGVGTSKARAGRSLTPYRGRRSSQPRPRAGSYQEEPAQPHAARLRMTTQCRCGLRALRIRRR
jgi:hypothetical protein